MLPPTNPEHVWELLYDTSNDDAPTIQIAAATAYPLRDRSLALFRTVPVAAEPVRPAPIVVAGPT
jgi:glycogen operon protein